MRKGQNPVKQLSQVTKPQRVTVAILNHIPFLNGFYSDMLKVLEISLSTLGNEAGLPFDLLVFDNGSCQEARTFLLNKFEKGNIQSLILSDKNMGKGGAWNVMLAAAPGEIIAYADNDVLYHPMWLSESVKILETYPNTGMVTSRPFHTKPELYSAVIDWATNKTGVEVKRGQYINPEWNREFLLSVGRSEEEIDQDMKLEDVQISYKGVSTYAGASHWQFIAWKHVLMDFLPIDLSKPLGQVLKLDEMINEKGYLRLMTSEPFTMNLSNSVELPGNVRSPELKRRRILDLPIFKAPLMRIYNAIFKLYYKG
jgi:hypothetical protein